MNLFSSDGAPLQINKETGAVKLVGQPEGKAYQFVIKAVDNGYPVREGSASVRINVIPRTEKALEFQRSLYRVQINETASSGIRISTLVATSGDANTVIAYRFVQGNLRSTNASDVFSIGKYSGSIHLAGALDAETVPKYNLLVKAYDTKNPASQAYIHVEIDVNDVNDNAPMFESKEYNVTIPENIAVNTKFFQISASDADDKGGSHLKYRFMKSNKQKEFKKLFAVDPNTGFIRTIGKLNTKIRSIYELEIRVQDGKKADGKRYHDSTKIRVTVLDTNNSPPVFVRGQRVSNVREDHVVGEKVASVLAQDVDKNPTIRYYIMSGNENGVFKIDHVTGEIKLLSALDREVVSRHSLSIIAYDGFFTANVTVTIVVSDTNDNSPICLKAFYRVKVMEGAGLSTSVAKVEAVDADSDDQLTYSLQGDGVSKFTVNAKTGNLFYYLCNLLLLI